MSGSPVYLDGKLAGALSLKLGIFTKEPIAGVTPIESILNPPTQSAPAQASNQQLSLPSASVTSTGLPLGSTLQPIETPLVFSGFQPAAIQQFAGQLQSYGMAAPPRPAPKMRILPQEIWPGWFSFRATHPSTPPAP
jgi:hypothetical protein